MKNRKIMMILAASLCLTMTVPVVAEEADAEETVEEMAEEDIVAVPEDLSIPRLISEEDLDDYITLGDYKGLDIERVEISVSDTEIEEEISHSLEDASVQVTNGTVETGDTVVINFVGKKDGVAFEGGTADNYPLEIGSGMFIDGFEDGLIGMSVGETKDLNLVFPEYYQSEELAGAEVIFTVTVNRINRPAELTDEWVQENSESETVEEYKEAVRAELEKERERMAGLELAQEGIYQVWVSTEIKGYPEKELQSAKDMLRGQFEAFAQSNGMTLEEYIESQGSDMKSFEEEILDGYAKQRVAQDLIVQSILDAEEIPMDDEAIRECAQQLLDDYGYDTLEELISVYTESEVYASIALYRVENFIVDNANIVEPEEEDTEDDLAVEEIEAAEEDASEETAETAGSAEESIEDTSEESEDDDAGETAEEAEGVTEEETGEETAEETDGNE